MGASSAPRCIVSIDGQDHACSICVCPKCSAVSFLLQARCAAVTLCSLPLGHPGACCRTWTMFLLG